MTYDWLNISTLSGQVFGNSVDTYDGWLFITTNSGADLTDVTDTVTVDLNLLSDSEDIATSAITLSGKRIQHENNGFIRIKKELSLKRPVSCLLVL
ncbi:MAG: hypothetical protein IIB44_07015 [Candidatus Marinimicrobia bacterium]|nr:hypothetical protein [Candidatus Neomarinimicrobiota bacterium]MCH8067892.1 hypothetical protein [Candidatus Neomarinimicrobiota bacterium]